MQAQPLGEEIFVDFYKDGPLDLDSMLFEQDSSPLSTSSADSPNHTPFSENFYDPNDIFNTGTFFGEIDKLPIPPPVEVQVKQEIKTVADLNEEPPRKRQKIAGKKRTRAQQIKTNQISKQQIDPSILMDKDKLLTLSSKKLDEYVQSLSRPLTPEEEKQLKRQRRLIKNRESAQLSRQKKKQYVEDLEKSVQSLTAETDTLRSQVTQLSQKNKHLEEQVNLLQNYIQQQGHQIPPSPLFNKNTAATAGLCMFVILFSFGLFLSSGTAPNALEFSAPRVYTGRTLQEYPAIEAPKDIPQISAKRHERDFDEIIPLTKTPKIDLYDQPYLNTKYWIEEEEEELEVGFSLSGQNQIALQPQTNNEIKQQNHNNTFIYCSEAHQLASTIATQTAPDGAPVINILLPAAALNGTVSMSEIPEPENSLLEVSCQVLNITVFPYFPTVDHLAAPHLLS